MYGLRTSCYVRVPFAFTGNLQNVAGLTLKIHYNDGFVAYLNGIEIARRNFTGIAAWDSAADRQLSGDNFESIPILNFAERAAAGQQPSGDPGPECLGVEPGLPDLGGAYGRRIRRAGDSHAGEQLHRADSS